MQLACINVCRREQRALERQIRDNSRLEKVAQKQIKEAAKRNDMTSAKVLAKELIHTRKVTTRLYTNKAHMMSMNSQLTEQLGMVKVAGTLARSTQVHPVTCVLPNPQECLPPFMCFSCVGKETVSHCIGGKSTDSVLAHSLSSTLLSENLLSHERR